MGIEILFFRKSLNFGQVLSTVNDKPSSDNLKSYNLHPTIYNLAQLFRGLAVQAKLDLLFLTRSFREFMVYMISDTVTNFANVSGTLLLSAKFNGIGRWNTTQIVFMLSYALVVGGIMETLFNYNISHISRRIGRGQLDHSLIQPRPLWVSLFTEGFMPFYAFMTLMPSLALFVWAVANSGINLSISWIFFLLLNLFGSVLLTMSFSYLWGSLAFWAQREAEEICSPLMGMFVELRPFPLDGLASHILGTLVLLFPVGMTAWYPARALLGLDKNPMALFMTPFVALAFALCATFVFLKGYAHYLKTGSGRYVSSGHRR